TLRCTAAPATSPAPRCARLARSSPYEWGFSAPPSTPRTRWAYPTACRPTPESARPASPYQPSRCLHAFPSPRRGGLGWGEAPLLDEPAPALAGDPLLFRRQIADRRELVFPL